MQLDHTNTSKQILGVTLIVLHTSGARRLIGRHVAALVPLAAATPARRVAGQLRAQRRGTRRRGHRYWGWSGRRASPRLGAGGELLALGSDGDFLFGLSPLAVQVFQPLQHVRPVVQARTRQGTLEDRDGTVVLLRRVSE